MPPNESLADLVAAVQASANYRAVSPELIARIGQVMLARYPTPKAALKATKTLLHQIGGAFMESSMPYERWLAHLREAAATGDLRATCREVMAHHASMRERLPFLDDFYAAIFAELPPVASVADLACGLHPLALPWLPLAQGATYHARDIYTDLMAFIGAFLPIAGVAGTSEAVDVTRAALPEPVDVAFLLKAIPCLEQMDATAVRGLLQTIPARHLVVSFPSQSLGGRHKGMPAFYEAHFRDLLADRDWPIRRLVFPTELVFVVTTERG
jgi:16S rRNA (guanine(1405)-N(7))-methyltransferase